MPALVEDTKTSNFSIENCVRYFFKKSIIQFQDHFITFDSLTSVSGALIIIFFLNYHLYYFFFYIYTCI
jgi:hypothetical protein